MKKTLRRPTKNTSGFTLLEVMVALLILSMGFTIVLSLQSTAMIGNSGVYRTISATYLMHYVITDLELYYQMKGFPENTIEGQDCDLPQELDNDFQCEYDLIKIDIEPDQLNEMVTNSLSSFLGEDGLAGMANAMSGGAGKGLSSGTKSLSNLQGLNENMMQLLPVLAPYFGPEGEFFMQMCPININAILSNVMGASMFLPQIVKFAEERTRKLVVRIKWKEGFRGEKEIKVEYFITSLPQEMIEMMHKKEMIDDLLDQGGGAMPYNKGFKGKGPYFKGGFGH